MAFRQPWFRSSTIPTAQPASRSSRTPTGEKRYILHPVGLNVGRQEFVSGPEADILVGNALPLKNIPVGTTVHNVELKPGKGAQMVRSAGGSAQLMAREGEFALVKMPSGEPRNVLSIAWRPSGRWATWSMKTSPSARPDAISGWAAAGESRRGHEPGGPSARWR